MNEGKEKSRQKRKGQGYQSNKAKPIGNTGQQITGWEHRQEKQSDKDSVTSYTATLGKPAPVALITGVQSWLFSAYFSQRTGIECLFPANGGPGTSDRATKKEDKGPNSCS